MEQQPRKTTGMTLLRHLLARTRRREKVNPNGIMDITIGDAKKIAEEFMEMKEQRDEALRILGMRSVPNKEPLLPHTNVEPRPSKPTSKKQTVHSRWDAVLKKFNEQV